MRAWVALAVGLGLGLGACGSDDDAEFGSGGSAGSAGSATGGSAGSGTGGSAGSGTGGSAGSGTGGSAGSGTGGSAGAGTGGTAGAGTGGSAGAATCPGTAPGCVIDWAGQFNQTGTADGVGTAARFDAVGDITGDGTHVWVATHNAVRRIEIATATVSTFAGAKGQAGFQNGTGSAARFDYVAGIATDGTTVWVVDTGNVVVRAIDIASAAVTTLAGSPGQAGSQDGTGAQARFAEPRGIAWDGTWLWVAEVGNNAVRRIHPQTGQVLTVAGDNGQGSTNGTGNIAAFDRPRGIEAFGGNVYVGDTENHQVRLVVPGATALATLVSAPIGSSAGYADGIGVAAQLRRLRGVTNDGTDLIVADSDNFVIRKVTLPAHAVSTIAGTGGNQAHAEGIGPAAAFDKPMDVHFDPGTGDLFIVENSVIRRMYYK